MRTGLDVRVSVPIIVASEVRNPLACLENTVKPETKALQANGGRTSHRFEHVSPAA